MVDFVRVSIKAGREDGSVSCREVYSMVALMVEMVVKGSIYFETDPNTNTPDILSQSKNLGRKGWDGKKMSGLRGLT